jgi:hypothetical protein
MEDLLSHAKYALLPFLGKSNCFSLASTCKQGNEAVKSTPHCNYLEGKSFCIKKSCCQLRSKRNAFYVSTTLSVDFFTFLMDGSLIILDRRSQCVYRVCPCTRTVNPLRGKEIGRVQVPYNVWGLFSENNTLTLAHSGLLRTFDLRGNDMIEICAVVLMDEDIDNGNETRTLIKTSGGFECLLSDDTGLRIAANGQCLAIEHPRNIKAFCERCECSSQCIFVNVNRPYTIACEFVEPSQILMSDCGLIIHVLDSQGIWSFYGRSKRMLFPCKGIRAMHLHNSSLFYVLNNDIYLLQ